MRTYREATSPFIVKWTGALAAAVLLLSLGCAVIPISQYDEQIDKSATNLQVEMDSFLTRLDSAPQPSYDASQQFYTDYAVKLRAVEVRAQSHPKNSLTEQQIALMIKNLEELRSLHEAGPIGHETITHMRDLFNQGWRAIITLEINKKGGRS